MKIGERFIRSSNISSDRILGTIQRDVAKRHGVVIIPDTLTPKSDVKSDSAVKVKSPAPRAGISS